MSDNIKYYYMRLKENFFDTNDILVLESLQDGYLYSNILLKLYLRSLKDDGKLMFNNRIPYNPQMIATITRHQVGTVEKALSYFKEMGLIEVLDNGAIYMLDIQTYIGKTSTEAERIKRFRSTIKEEKSKQIDTSVQMYTKENVQMYTKDRDRVRDRVKDIDKDIKDIENKKPSKPKKHKYGINKNVLLTDDEYSKLTNEYSNAEQLINNLDEYLAIKEVTYKNHYLVIKRWERKAQENKTTKQPIKKDYSETGW